MAIVVHGAEHLGLVLEISTEGEVCRPALGVKEDGRAVGKPSNIVNRPFAYHASGRLAGLYNVRLRSVDRCEATGR